MMMEHERADMAKTIACSIFTEECGYLKALYSLLPDELRRGEKSVLDNRMSEIRKSAQKKLEEALKHNGIKNAFSVSYDVYFQLQDPTYAYINWDEAMSTAKAHRNETYTAVGAAGGAAAGMAFLMHAMNAAGKVGGLAALCLVAAAAAGSYGLVKLYAASADNPGMAERCIRQAIHTKHMQNVEILRQWCAMLEDAVKKLEV